MKCRRGKKFDQEGVFEECTKASTADQVLRPTREVAQLSGLQQAHADHAENAGARQQDLAHADKTARQEQELKAELRSFRQLLQNASSNDLLAQWQPALAQAAQQLGAFSWEQNQSTRMRWARSSGTLRNAKGRWCTPD